MKRRTPIRTPALILLWMGGVLCGIALQNCSSWALTVAFLSTLGALLALAHCEAGGPPQP
jgi:hypothetical protein